MSAVTSLSVVLVVLLLAAGFFFAGSETALTAARGDALRRGVTEIAIVGGAGIYADTMALADRLVITLRAVEKYVSSIFGKLGLPATGSESRRVLAVLLFLRS